MQEPQVKNKSRAGSAPGKVTKASSWGEENAMMHPRYQLTEQQHLAISANREQAMLKKQNIEAAKAAQLRLAFDQADADLQSEPELEEGIWAEADLLNDEGEQQPEDPGAKVFTKRRLRCKTAPANAPAFPSRALLKLSEYRVRKAKLKLAQLDQRRQVKIARQHAMELIAAQPELGDGDIHRIGTAAPFSLPHPTHRIVELHGDATTIYCKQCSAWSSRIALRSLSAPCHGLLKGGKSQLRLLQCGVRPGPGAKLPAHLRMPKGKRRKKW